MPLELPDDYWLHVPGGTYVLGFTPDEARRWSRMAADFMNAQPLPEMDAWDEIDRRERETGNPEYLEQLVLGYAPAREVEVPAYSIARTRVTRGQFLQFVRDAGYTANDVATQIDRLAADPDEPVVGRSWGDVEAFAVWAGHRVPFEDEWERAARGSSRSLFPWGDDRDPKCGLLMDTLYNLRGGVAPRWTNTIARQFASPDGFVAYPDPAGEWCADLWVNLRRETRNLTGWDRTSDTWARVSKGYIAGLSCIAVADRSAAAPENEGGLGYGFRLVKHNSRVVPTAPPMTGWSGARAKVREFEATVVGPALQGARRMLDAHRSFVWRDNDEPPDELLGILGEWGRNCRASDPPGISRISSAYFDDPSRPAYGMFLGAITQESIRQVVTPKHGVFIFDLHYRLDAQERILARPTSFFRMHYDGQWHRFDDQFRPGETDTPIAELTPELIVRALLTSFAFYDDYADADAPPSRPGRRETKTPIDPVFRVR